MAIDSSETLDRKIVPYCEETMFKKPLHPVPKLKRTNLQVLDEEAYIQNLENIIERDFFPDSSKLKAQAEYLEAVEKNDLVKIRELHIKYATKSTPTSRTGIAESECNSPRTFETPLLKTATPHNLLGEEKKDENCMSHNMMEKSGSKDKQLSLDSYLTKNTSEDNASFSVIMEEAKKQHQMKYSWLYKEENKYNNHQNEMLALPSIERQAIEEKRPAQIDTWLYKNKNSLMYVPDGVDLSVAELQQMKQKQREIVHSNTCFQKSPFNEQANRQAISEAAQIQARQKEGKIGIDGKELLPAESPKINGYGFVKTPSPMPGVEDSPLMTWGEIEGTPFCLDGRNTPAAHTPGPTFHIPELPARDKLAHILADKVRQRHRVKKQAALRAVQENLVSPHRQKSCASEQLGTMSPAAQRLASSRLGIRMGMDKALLASYTPRPLSTQTTPNSTPQSSVHSQLKSPQTPNLSKSLRSADDEEDDSLTDGLLHIPKRPRAMDFFIN